MFLDFFFRLKDARIPVTLGEFFTFLDTIKLDFIQYSIENFYYMARASLVKDERLIDRFDVVFGEYFKGIETLKLEDVLEHLKVPKEWLQKMLDKHFTKEEIEEIKSLGGFDELMKTLEQRLKETINFLVQHLPGASELAEISERGTIVLDSQRDGDPETILLGKSRKSYDRADFQRALDEFKTRNLCNLEIGRLYERYIGYLREQDNWRVAFTGILGGYGDLGRDLVCIKDNQHQIIQAKCWSKKKEIHFLLVGWARPALGPRKGLNKYLQAIGG